MKNPSNKELKQFIKDYGLNVLETPNQDCSDMEQIEMGIDTYLSENYEDVFNYYLQEAA